MQIEFLRPSPRAVGSHLTWGFALEPTGAYRNRYSRVDTMLEHTPLRVMARSERWCGVLCGMRVQVRHHLRNVQHVEFHKLCLRALSRLSSRQISLDCDRKRWGFNTERLSRRACVRVCFTLNHHFHASTSSTPNVRAVFSPCGGQGTYIPSIAGLAYQP